MLKYLFLVSFLGFLPGAFSASVEVKKSTEGWNLLVDGSPFFIKGVGCNAAEGPENENYLLMAKEMGANAVRTWGVKPRAYFDRAQEMGLLVNAGVWFNPVRGDLKNSYKDRRFCNQLKTETLEYVKGMKDHPALLSWNLGNEVFTFTKNEGEQRAFGRFLQDLIEAVHKEDPLHPIVYACASHKELPYLKKYVPDLDIVGMNTYGGYGSALRWLATNRYDKPVIATEFGPMGGWTQKKDINGLPYDPLDQFKAADFSSLWEEIIQSRNQSLGGFAFVLGNQRNQDSLTWFNINFGDLKRQAYWTLYKLYTGREPLNRPPKIRFIKFNKVKDLEPEESVIVSVTAADPEGDPMTFEYFFTDIASDPLIVETPKIIYPKVERLSDEKATVQVPNKTGKFRLYVLVKDNHQNVAIGNRSVGLK